MRGLKPPTVPNINIGNVASFTDAWIETSVVIQRLYVFLVASFTDAWIETPPFVQQWRAFESHLLQMRGLKLGSIGLNIFCLRSHLLQMRGLKRV